MASGKRGGKANHKRLYANEFRRYCAKKCKMAVQCNEESKPRPGEGTGVSNLSEAKKKRTNR